jgi:hypothetical protein
MVTTTVVFLFLFPLFGGLFSGESFAGHDHSAVRIMMTTAVYWPTFTAVYLLASGRARTVQPDGPRGIPTSFGVLKEAAASTTAWKAMLVFAPLALIQLFFIRSSGLGISGGGLAMLTLPYHLVVLRLLTAGGTAAFSAIFAARLFGKAAMPERLVAAAGLATNLGFALIAGRRPVLYALGLAALGVMWTGRRRQAVSMLLLGVSVWFLVFIFSPIFLRARTIWRSPNSPGVIAAFEMAIQQSSERREALDTESKENIKQRMNSYLFWLEFYDRAGDANLGGKLLIQAVVMNIPRAIAGWAKYAYGATEEAMFGTEDIANNVCLESIIDLGPLGPVVYGIIFGLVFAALDVLVFWMSRRNKYVALMAVGEVFPYLLSPEADLMAYIGSLRQILIFSVMTVAAVAMFGPKPVTKVIGIRPGRLTRKQCAAAA